MELNKWMYWYKVEESEESTNSSTVRIKIPILQKINIENFESLYNEIYAS